MKVSGENSVVGDGAFRSLPPRAVADLYRREGWWGRETLADHVGRHARDNPEGLAFISAAGRFTWLEYDRHSDALASVFLAAGLAEGERIAVMMPDGPTIHTVFLAAEKAGCPVVGIGARAGEREVRHVLEQTGAAAFVSYSSIFKVDAPSLFSTLRASGLPLRRHIVVPAFEVEPDAPVNVDGVPCEPGTIDLAFLASRRIGPDDLFIINSTSGTTGMPKCVLHTQNRWMYFHQKAAENAALNEADVFFGAVPAPFGFGLWTSHFTPTLLGAPTVTLERFSAAAALAALEEFGVTVLCCVSTQFIMMLNAPEMDVAELSKLRVMFTGGEMVPLERAHEFERRFGAAVLQFFGSNETGLLSGTTLDDSTDRRLRTAGRIVPEMSVRLFDEGEDVTDLGRGQPGCRGPATCMGYLGGPEVNAELYTADGWMLMGDVCTLDADGYLSVIGRKSDFIIRGGKNVSAGEVESLVATHPSVALAAAVPMPDPVFGERVCVFVELRRGMAPVTLEEVTERLATLGASKELYPERLIVLDELPRSSGGKVAKGELTASLASPDAVTP